ncbi:hypothetical protein W02_05110 [Nitrospira sp. KM1]|nr:hypothetical protein W02_05110 [Nitrospira sp. KM1]
MLIFQFTQSTARINPASNNEGCPHSSGTSYIDPEVTETDNGVKQDNRALPSAVATALDTKQMGNELPS